jgi:hypothetical protein
LDTGSQKGFQYLEKSQMLIRCMEDQKDLLELAKDSKLFHKKFIKYYFRI